MSRCRIDTTVDEDVLASARSLRTWASDAALIDAALHALLAASRRTSIDSAYEAYDAPLDEPDGWGDLASFRTAVACD